MAGFCPECGTARADDAATCANCRHQFSEATPTAVDAPELQPEPEARSKWLSPKRLGAGIGALALASVGGWIFTHGGLGLSAETPVDISLLPVSFGGKCGYVDTAGKMAINPQFDSAEAFNANLGLAPIKIAKKWGLIDHAGKYVINPQFDAIEIKSDNATIGVSLDGKIGTVDSTGKFVINPQFDELSDFDTKMHAIARVGQKYGIVDAAGKFLISPQYDHVYSDKAWDLDRGWDIFAEPLLVLQDGKYGFVDSAGKIVIQPQFSDAFPFTSGGFAPASIQQPDNEALNQLYAKNANAAQTIIRNNLGSFLLGGFSYDGKTLTFNINNPAMTVPIDNWLGSNLPTLWIREAGSAGDFKLVQNIEAPSKNVYGYIDHAGKFVITPQFASAYPFTGSGLAAVMVGDKWGYVDTSGKVAVNPQFSETNAFQKINGEWLAVVAIPGETSGKSRYGLIDTKGAFRITPQFDSLVAFSPNGYAVAATGDQLGVIDTSGKYIVQPTYSTLLEVGKSGQFFFVKSVPGAKDVQEIGIIDKSGQTITSVRGGLCDGFYSLSR